MKRKDTFIYGQKPDYSDYKLGAEKKAVQQRRRIAGTYRANEWGDMMETTYEKIFEAYDEFKTEGESW